MTRTVFMWGLVRLAFMVAVGCAVAPVATPEQPTKAAPADASAAPARKPKTTTGGMCQPGRAKACNDDGACGHFRCNNVTKQCEVRCDSSAKCARGSLCHSGVCVQSGTCGTCEKDSECGLYRCDSLARHECLKACTGALDCNSGATCTAGKCVKSR